MQRKSLRGFELKQVETNYLIQNIAIPRNMRFSIQHCHSFCQPTLQRHVSNHTSLEQVVEHLAQAEGGSGNACRDAEDTDCEIKLLCHGFLTSSHS